MKKILIVTLTLLIAFSSFVFATDPINPETNEVYAAIAVPYSKTSARMEAMGGAGISGFSNQDALYVNPASLANPGFVFNTPSLALTIHDFKALNNTGVIETAINNPEQFDDDSYKLSLAQKLLSIYGTGRNNAIATVDAGVGAKLGCFAFALDTKAGAITYTPGGASSIKIIPTMDVVLSAGLGLRVLDLSAMSLDIGAAARLNLRGYWKAIEGNDVILHMNEDNYFEELPENTPVMYGYAIPIDLGLNLNLPFGITVSGVVKNINGTFHMNAYDNYHPLEEMDISEVFDNETFSFATPMSVNAGFGWNPDFGSLSNIINPAIAIDVVNVDKLLADFSTTNLLTSLKAGAEVELLRTIELRAGINQGYTSFGVGLNILNILHMEASYYRHEFGTLLGDNPVDALTIRFNTIWER
jgi:hypothetical protein